VLKWLLAQAAHLPRTEFLGSPPPGAGSQNHPDCKRFINSFESRAGPQFSETIVTLNSTNLCEEGIKHKLLQPHKVNSPPHVDFLKEALHAPRHAHAHMYPLLFTHTCANPGKRGCGRMTTFSGCRPKKLHCFSSLAVKYSCSWSTARMTYRAHREVLSGHIEHSVKKVTPVHTYLEPRQGSLRKKHNIPFPWHSVHTHLEPGQCCLSVLVLHAHHSLEQAWSSWQPNTRKSLL